MKTQTLTRLRHALSSLVLLAVFVACLIPAGFMPGVGTGEDGVQTFSIVICTSTGMKTIEIDGNGDPTGHDSELPSTSCAYAPVLAQDIPVPHPSLARNTALFMPVHYNAIAVAEIAAYRHVYTAQAPPQSFLI